MSTVKVQLNYIKVSQQFIQHLAVVVTRLPHQMNVPSVVKVPL